MGTRFVSCTESPVHANYKNAIVDAKETGTLVLNKKSTPCIRALKSERTRAIHGEGLMAPDALKGIRELYFHGDMEAAPALAGQSAGLIDAVKSAPANHRGNGGSVFLYHRQARRVGNGTGIRMSLVLVWKRRACAASTKDGANGSTSWRCMGRDARRSIVGAALAGPADAN